MKGWVFSNTIEVYEYVKERIRMEGLSLLINHPVFFLSSVCFN